MDALRSIYAVLRDVIDSGVLWKLCFFAALMYAMHAMHRLQKDRDDKIDFFQFIQDPLTGQLSPVRMAYMVTLSSTTYVYIIAATRPGVSLTEITYLTFIYAGIWVTSQAANKLAERPPAPILPPAPVAPTVTVNNQPPSAPNDGSGSQNG